MSLLDALVSFRISCGGRTPAWFQVARITLVQRILAVNENSMKYKPIQVLI